MRGCGFIETKGPKLKHSLIDDEAKKFTTVGMNRDLKILVLQVDGDHPIWPSEWSEEPTDWTLLGNEFGERTRSDGTSLTWAATSPKPARRRRGGCRTLEREEPARLLPYVEDP